MMPMPAQTSATTTVSTPLHITPARGRQGFPGTEKNKKSVWHSVGLGCIRLRLRQGKERQGRYSGVAAARNAIASARRCPAVTIVVILSRDMCCYRSVTLILTGLPVVALVHARARARAHAHARHSQC